MHQKSDTLRLLEGNVDAVLDFSAGKAADEVVADRALNELGALIRKLDDAEAIASILRERGLGDVGSLVQGDGKSEPLYLRDMTNKLAHCSKFIWSAESQSVECVSRDSKRWQTATIDLVRLRDVVQSIVGL